MNTGLPTITFLSLIILLTYFPGHVTAAVVALRSIELYKTHDWLNEPTVYFECKGENKTVMPDVKKTKVVYTFKDEESWQPLTNFTNKKCKRCGIYEKDFLRHDIFDEWELCPSDFTAPDGNYTHLKEKEFNATFSCAACLDLVADHIATANPPSDSGKKSRMKGIHVFIVIVICAAVASLVIIGLVGGYKYWKKRKRQQEQARFLKLFEEHDDMEDELDLQEML